ncbi:MAG: cadherin domain-containing protein, partial [Planctomycetota bacterium]
MNDHDVADPDAHSAFRGVRVVDASADASGAIDQDLSYTWEQVSGPAVELSDANGLTPTFEAPEVGEPTELQFRVTASDGENATSELVTITVNPVNDAPEAMTFIGGGVSENAPAGTLVAVAAASDIDVNDTLSYSLADDADGRFAIDPMSGEIRTTGALDHEDSSSHTIRVVATDPGGLSIEADLKVTVDNVNEAPSALQFTGGVVSEDAGLGTVVATAAASDAEANDVLTYTLADDAAGLFTIDPSTGEIRTTGPLDHEAASSHTVRVVATDAGGLSNEADLVITVSDVNERPVFADGHELVLDAEQGQVVSVDAGASDPEGDALSYSWRQVSGPDVEIRDADGTTLEFVAPKLETADEQVFFVEVTDGEQTSERVVRIAVAAGDAGYDLESDMDGQSAESETEVVASDGTESQTGAQLRPSTLDPRPLSVSPEGGGESDTADGEVELGHVASIDP